MRHRSSLYAYIFACLRNHADAEDVFQDVSVAVIELADRCPDEAGFRPWCLEIARRRVLAHLRKSSRRGRTDAELIAALSDAADRVEKEELWGRRAALFDCLDELPERQRSLIAARYAPQSTIGELATRLNSSVQAVYARVKRIKQILRECVERRLASERTS